MKAYLKIVINNLKSGDYYFAQIFGASSALFLMILWVYLNRRHDLELTTGQIVMYFFTVYALSFLFNFTLVDKFVHLLHNSPHQLLLVPKHKLIFMINKALPPILLEAAPLIVLAFALSVVFGIFTWQTAILFVLFLLYAIIAYIAMSLAFALMEFFIRLDSDGFGFTSFFLQWVGFTWNGSFIPLMFVRGVFASMLAFLPFAFAALPISLIFNETPNTRLLFISLLYTIFFTIFSVFLIKRYEKHIQIYSK